MICHYSICHLYPLELSITNQHLDPQKDNYQDNQNVQQNINILDSYHQNAVTPNAIEEDFLGFEENETSTFKEINTKLSNQQNIQQDDSFMDQPSTFQHDQSLDMHQDDQQENSETRQTSKRLVRKAAMECKHFLNNNIQQLP